MKKCIAIILVVLCIPVLCCCGWNSQREVPAVIDEKITQIEITHTNGIDTKTWIVGEDGIISLREWLHSLDYNRLESKDAPSLDDGTYLGIYKFASIDGDWSGFSYIIIGEDDCYIQSEDQWFSVLNPVLPPFYMPFHTINQ